MCVRICFGHTSVTYQIDYVERIDFYYYPPAIIDETMFSCEVAMRNAFTKCQLETEDIDWFGLYDCFPICFIRAVEGVGLAQKGMGGFHHTTKS